MGVEHGPLEMVHVWGLGGKYCDLGLGGTVFAAFTHVAPAETPASCKIVADPHLTHAWKWDIQNTAKHVCSVGTKEIIHGGSARRSSMLFPVRGHAGAV